MENKNNYNQKRNKKNNYYYKNNKHYPNYYRKRKNKRNENVLLSEKPSNIEEKPILDEIVKEEIAVGNEQEYIPIKKEDMDTSKKMPVFKMAIGVVILIAIVFGVSYSFFNFYKEDSRQADISGGEMYIRVSSPPETTNISLSKLYPRTITEARSRSDNYIDFVIKAKNTSSTKVLYYTIDITDGEAIQGKNRINRQYIKYDLQEKVNGEYVYVRNAMALNEFNYRTSIPVNTTNEVTKEYRLRMWLSENILISDTEVGRTFTQSEFANLYANYHIEVMAKNATSSAGNVEFDNTVTNFDCEDAQCAVEHLKYMFGLKGGL